MPCSTYVPVSAVLQRSLEDVVGVFEVLHLLQSVVPLEYHLLASVLLAVDIVDRPFTHSYGSLSTCALSWVYLVLTVLAEEVHDL